MSEDSFLPYNDGVETQARAGEGFWRQARRLWKRRRLIAGLTAVAALGAVVVSLLIPNEYRASARVLAPTDSGNPLSAVLGRNLSSAARLLGSGPGGDYTRYLAILTSRSMMDAVIDSFNLEEVYELEDERFAREKTLKELRERTDFGVDMEYEYLSVSVIDQDRERAASMANMFVEGLNERNQALTSQNARLYRTFIENRYHESIAALDSLLDAAKTFQQRYGVFDLPAQTAAFFEQIGALRAEEMRLRVQHDALQAQLGSDNPQVQSLASALASTSAQYRAALNGNEAAFPIPQSAAPEVARQYALLERDRMIQQSILEVIAPLYEGSRLEEEKQTQAVQVVDEAIPPQRKMGPKRSIIVISITLGVFLLVSLYVLVMSWWAQNHTLWQEKLTRTEESEAPHVAHEVDYL